MEKFQEMQRKTMDSLTQQIKDIKEEKNNLETQLQQQQNSPKEQQNAQKQQI